MAPGIAEGHLPAQEAANSPPLSRRIRLGSQAFEETGQLLFPSLQHR